jgi:hypothetical protein
MGPKNHYFSYFEKTFREFWFPKEEKTTIIGTPKLRVPHEEQSKLNEARFKNEKIHYL